MGSPAQLTNRPAGLFGRDEERRAVRAALEGRGCVIAGPAGVGKSRLAADAVSDLGAGQPVVRVVGTSSAAGIPFGAVGHLLPGGRPPTIGDFVAAVRDGTFGPAPVLLVDDAQWLDDASAAVVLAIATTRVAPLLLTLRSHELAPDAVVALWRERHLDRVDLQPLSEAEVELLVEDLLGAPCHARVHEWIQRLAEGNPLYVTELVGDARRTGHLELRDGRWHLAVGHAPLERLQDLLGAHIGSVSDTARVTLELLAVGAPMALGLVEDLVPGPGLEELERSHLAVVRDDRLQGLLVDLAHPLHGELVRSELPETAARRIRRDLAGALARHGDGTPATRLQIAGLLLESGQVDEDLFLEASAIALQHGSPDLARRLAEALPTSSLPAALLRARGLGGAGRLEEIDEVLAPFEAEAAGAPFELAAVYAHSRVGGLLRGDPGRAELLIDRVAGWHDDPDWRALVATMRCWVAVQERSYGRARALVEASLAEPGLPSERRRQLLLAYGLALTRLGRVDDYCELMSEVEALTAEVGAPQLDVTMNIVRREGGLVAAGRDLAGVRSRLVGELERAHERGERLQYGTLVYLMASLDHVQGHHAEARAGYQRMIDHLSGADAFSVGPMGHVMMAISLSYLGEERLARRAIEHVDAVLAQRPGLAPWLEPDLRRARVMAEVAAGRESDARAQLLSIAESCDDDVLVASESLHVALLLGAEAARCAAGLEALAEHAQDDTVHLWAHHARAIADRDPGAQLEAAQAFEAAGLDLDAAQAGALAAAAFEAIGSKDGVSRASTLAARCAKRCPGVQIPALTVRLNVPDLTPREWEIAALAARGESNPAIAETLTLSVRTVETYVLRVYRKLGVNNRTGLAKVLGLGRD